MFNQHEPGACPGPGIASGTKGTTEQDEQCPALMEFTALKQVFITSLHVGITLQGRD